MKIENINMRTRVIIAVAVPLICTFLFGSYMSVRRYNDADNASRLARIVNEVPKISALIHDLQRERGLSSGYLSASGDSEFRNRLQDQYGKTKDAITAFTDSLSRIDTRNYDGSFARALEEGKSSLDDLSGTRSQVMSRQLSISDTGQYYSGAISRLLKIIVLSSEISNNDKITKELFSYYEYLSAIELAGQERAVASQALASSEFTLEQYNRFASLIAQQNILLKNFSNETSDELRELFKSTMNGSNALKVSKMRDTILGTMPGSKVGSGSAQPVDDFMSPMPRDYGSASNAGAISFTNAQWFETSTNMINDMIEIEHTILDKLTADISKLKGDASLAFYQISALLAVVILVVGGLAYTILSSMVRQEKKEAVLRQAALRFERSMDGASACVMMSDPDLNIIYMNEQQVKMMRAAEPDLKKELVSFDVDNLIGKNIDVFHKNPAHQRNMLANLNTRYETTIKVGPRTFDLVAMPLFDEDGARIGYSVEWIDKTAELAVMEEINTMINAANDGDLESRVTLNDKSGFFLQVAQGINNLAATMSTVANDLASNLQALSQGDLTARITNEYNGIFKQLQSDFNQTSERLSDIMMQIMQGSREISDSADEVTKGSGDLSNRTEQQASTLEETAASMEELTSTVKNNADNAKDANDAAGKTRNIAEQGSRVANDAGNAMQKIAESSQKITEIITVIDEIAFQTNLLALNAAVEAARAGDAGRGFAVVAQEVRTLAQRSAQSSKDIKALIDDSSKQVSEGVNLVKTAVESLQEIYTSIDNVSELVGQIASASVEQSTSLDEINQAVLEMDNMTQQNASMAQESKNVAIMMREKSYNLIELVEYFKTDEAQKTIRKAQNAAPTMQDNVVPAKPPANKPPVKKPIEAKKTGTNGAQHSGGTNGTYFSGPEDSENDADWKEF